MWKTIKYAINDTLGTKEFKPLDRLFFENRCLVPSKNVLKVLHSNGPLQIRDSTIKSFTPKLDGTISILTWIYYSGNGNLHYKVTKHSTGEVLYTTKEQLYHTSTDNQINIYHTINIQKNVTYDIELNMTDAVYYNQYIMYMTVCGDVIHESINNVLNEVI